MIGLLCRSIGFFKKPYHNGNYFNNQLFLWTGFSGKAFQPGRKKTIHVHAVGKGG
jgi:hypothetical protein